MTFFDATLHIWRHCQMIFRRKNHRISNRRLLIAYLKLKWMHLVLFRTFRVRGLHTVRALGIRFQFFHLPTFISLFEEIFIKDEYFFEAKRRDPVIIDCGANIGVATVYFKSIYPESTVIAFEPDRETFKCLRRNIEANGLRGVTAHQYALSDLRSRVRFYHDPDHPGVPTMSLMYERNPKVLTHEEVETVPLSEYVGGEVDFVKMDIEGLETAVIEELARAGRMRHVREMLIEYHHHITAEADGLSRLLMVLEREGFGYQFGYVGGRPLAGAYQDIHFFAYRK